MSNPIIIKFGGSLLDNQSARRVLLQTLAREWIVQQQSPEKKRSKIILVHGGGKDITRELEKRIIPAQFDKGGRRITDQSTMLVVEEVLGRINAQIVKEIEEYEGKALPLSGKTNSIVRAKILPELGLVGFPERIDKKVLSEMLMNPALPVFYSVALGPEGQTLNINADDFAQAIAIACQASRLIFLTDTGAVLDKNKRPIPQIGIHDIDKLANDGTISGGMVVKLQACRQALLEGVGEVIIAETILPGIEIDSGTIISKMGTLRVEDR